MKKLTLILSGIFICVACFSQGADKTFSSFEQAKQHPIIHEGSSPDFFEGAYLASAIRKKGMTQTERIKSLSGEQGRIIPGMEGAANVTGNWIFNLRAENPGLFMLDIEKHEETIPCRGEQMP